MFTHTYGVLYRSGAGTITNTTDSFTGNAEVNYDDTIPGTTTNKEADLAITVANIVSMVIHSDQALTIKTNSSTVPDDTITLTANKQKAWNSDMVTAQRPLTTDVTQIFVTNAGATDARLKFYVLLDQTP